ncbi:uncharacterized protein BX663DRAFT_508507 [Cokeromyces recurvatus]|uniref:uncharacterized protein n=1 Tax=Cokeromyces recurvatus TaxID=90255 RepID=UPI00221E7101|nr:uncharacterized protein BX663DRAFT_508507 [Cokeromyces recurvatus]KAI7903412.1 hypothetical protein BX663DRAFT_508507 [Cokeromyces recurvatus]
MHFTTCILYSFLFALSLTLLVHATTTKTFLESLQMNNKNNDDKDLLRRMNEDTGFSFTAEKRSLRTRSRIARTMKRNGSLLPDIVFPSITTQKPQAAAPQQQQQQAVSYYPYSLVTPQYQTYPSSANTALYYSPPANANNNPSPPITQNSVPSYVAPLTSAKNKKKKEEEEDDDDEEEEDEDEEDEEDYDADDLVTRRR